MTDKEKIQDKIADIIMDAIEEYNNNEINRPMIAGIYAGDILSVVDNQKEPVSEDLEEVSKEYADKNYAEWLDFCSGDERDDHYPISEAFRAGAQWQNNKLVKWLTSEADYLIEELKKGNRAYGLAEQYRAQLYREVVNKIKEYEETATYQERRATT